MSKAPILAVKDSPARGITIRPEHVLQVVERNEDTLVLIATTLLELITEIRDRNLPLRNDPDSLSNVAQELKDYIQIRCSNCTVKQRLAKIEDGE